MRQLPHSPRRQSGMTLIEVLVSLLIFSFGFLGLIGMQARAIQVSSDSEDRSRAALMANEIVGTMWAQNTLTPAASEITAWKARLADRTASTYLPNATGTVSAPVSGVVTVTVTWRAPSRKTTDQTSQYTTQVLMPK
ncbi:type IV pilus assembly protein PilV [Actimicrobium sp. GrIS 1.19]|uniref:type IV pilus modification protein PilV n=1 Tax=Actimicrobium sp. GrIS 1.19 TaxID=3071708 RepID=UPI002E029383|nr:type IV pilus assembly protein PilV [Actimicrobium sp. GrIS 1.19]